jgi:sarcosine oxidase delta subunit
MPGLAVRPFGMQPGDLDVEFDADERAEVATAVLAECALGPDGTSLGYDRARALPIGARLGALASVCRLSGRRELSWVFDCAGCGEELEAELALDALVGAQEAAEAADPAAVEWGDIMYRPRRPTGEDLRRWRDRPPSDAEIVAALAGPPGEVSAELCSAIEASLDAADPLVDAAVHLECPACGEAVELTVDLEGELLALARHDQDELFEDIAALAGAFHWSEREILALSSPRRSRYLALVE